MNTLALLLVLAGPKAPTPPHELYDYLAKPDSSFAYSVVRQSTAGTEIALTSQTWHGIPWKHSILFRQPAKIKFPGVGILYITGDGPRPGDLRDISMVTEATGMPTAMLFNVPNQPLFGNLREDDLIAHTFEQYLRTGDASWPLLFPMTKSAIRAMDAVVAITKNSSNPITQFVVTGASKRGWTTWFVGAAKDKRVKAIAPMVIDNLNVAAQMPHQLEMWGKYSEQIEDYSRRGLQQQLATPTGKHLAQIIDPFSYRKNITVPTLIVKGSNDPYWAVDALDLYYPALTQPKWVLTVPNVAHNLGGGITAAITIGAFARSVAGEFRMPTVNVDYATPSKSEAVFTLRNARPAPSSIKAWVAQSNTLDFRGSKYFVGAQLGVDASKTTVKVPIETGLNSAVYLELHYKVNGREFVLSTPTRVIRK